MDKPKVIDIRSRKPVTAAAANDAHDAAPSRPAGAGNAAARGALGALRYVAFLLLYWVRGPLRFLLGLVAGGSLLVVPILWFGLNSPNKAEILASVAGAGFVAFVVMWIYDSLLLRLSPEPIFLN